MKSSELRIGNYVHHYHTADGITLVMKDWISEVVKIDSFLGHVDLINFIEVPRFGQDSFTYAVKHIAPIPITDELLLRLGFIGSFKGDNGYYSYSFKDEYGHSLGDFSLSNYDSVQWKIWRGDRYCGIFKLEFVHELQNLFFVFNQIELQLKEPPIKVVNGTKSKFFQKALEDAKKNEI